MTLMPTRAVAVPVRASYALYTPGQRLLFLVVLFLVSISNAIDQSIVSVLLEPIKHEFGVSDTMLGLLSGAAFAVLNATLAIPVARWSDRGDRKLIVSLALAVWSVMTLMCGLAQTFWQLAAARMGVGLGEAGAIPPSHSLMVDYFPPEQRARALGVFTAAGSAGYLLAFVLGAHIATTQGWRAALVLVGAPGLLLAAVSYLVLKEPRLALALPLEAPRQESIVATVRALASKPTYRNLLISLTVYGLLISGIVAFVPSHLVRVLGIDLGAAGPAYGGVIALSTLAGAVAGGILADRLALRDVRWLLRLPAISLTLAFPFFAAAFRVHGFATFLVLFSVGSTLLNLAFPSTLAASHRVCGSPRRAMSMAIVLLFFTLVGSTLGPLAAGMMSDAFSARLGPVGISWALTAMTAFLPLSGWMSFLGSRTLPADIEV